MDKHQRNFVTNVKYFRHKKGFSQAEFAEKCNVATGTIGNIECGIAKPSFDLIIKMADVLCVEPAAFFTTIEILNAPNTKSNIIEEHKILSDIYEKLKAHFEK